LEKKKRTKCAEVLSCVFLLISLVSLTAYSVLLCL
jgi:hypothetical protein